MAIQRLTTWLCFAVCISLIGVSSQQKANLRLEVMPRSKHVTGWPSFNFTCTLSDRDEESVPIAGCGFRDHKSGASWDIGTGSATVNNTIQGYETIGIITHQNAGYCSLNMTGLRPWIRYILGCRVRPASGGSWRYAAMLVIVKQWSQLQYHQQPPGVVVSLPGSDVTITGLADDQINDCRIYLPPNKTEIYLHPRRTSENTTQYRVWFEGRRCGVTLLSVQPASSGFVRSLVWTISEILPVAEFVELLVATPPVSPPRLSVTTTDATFRAGDMLHATCVVGESRPVANITWLLGGEVVREDNWNEAPAESTWRWNYEPQGIIQRLSRPVTQLDDGKELKCRAGHLALPSGTLDSNTHIIRVGECGMPNSNPALVSGGNKAKTGEFPWHAAIFRVLNDGKHEPRCGGTLITTHVVITAAHCFYVVATSKLMASSSLAVVLGKLHLGWDVDLNDTNVQRFDVAELLAPADFRGNSHNYIHDIAVVKLATNAVLTSEVKVACIDWGLRRNTFNRDQLKTGDIGKVAGWGISYNTTERSPLLQWIDLPWVDMDTCRLNTHLGSRLYLTRGKFCAGYLNQRISVCPGDSGGGLVFLNATNQRYYLKGVVSTSLAYNTQTSTCHADHYTAFTSIGDYMEWIVEQL